MYISSGTEKKKTTLYRIKTDIKFKKHHNIDKEVEKKTRAHTYAHTHAHTHTHTHTHTI